MKNIVLVIIIITLPAFILFSFKACNTNKEEGQHYLGLWFDVNSETKLEVRKRTRLNDGR